MVKLESIHIVRPDGRESGILFKPPIKFADERIAAEFINRMEWVLNTRYEYGTIYTGSWEFNIGSNEVDSIQNT